MRRSNSVVRLAAAAVLVVSTFAVVTTGGSPVAAVPPARLPLGAPIPADVIAASAAPNSTYKPGPAIYGVGKQTDVPVTMSDGAILRADVFFPTDKASGKRAAGTFPVVLTQTPYVKGAIDIGGSSFGSSAGVNMYLIERGYINVVADVRGTGSSQGFFGFFDPIQHQDGVTLVNWAAKLPGSNGKVGLYGASYLGINQLLTAGTIGKNSPLKAIFPIVPANDIYKDTAFMGGLLDASFDAFYLPLTIGLNLAGPLLTALQNPTHLPAHLSPTLLQHIADVGTFDAALTAKILLGQAEAFDDAYWQARNPNNFLAKIAENNIPAYIVGGEFDLFQRGEPLNFSGLQNAWAGRAVDAPMLPNQQVTGRYQLLDGPWTHLAGSALDIGPLELEWFDTWLKDMPTGMDRTPTPLHYYDLGTEKFTEHAQYPFSEATPTRYYLSSKRSGSTALALQDGSLTTTVPAAGSNTLLWSPVGDPCNPATNQWSAGAISTATGYLSTQLPCINTDVLGSLAINKLNFTTPKFTSPQTIAGPITATVYMSANTSETQLVAQLQDVAPNGTVTPLTEGALLGSMRALDPATTWRTPSGEVLAAGHTYSKADQAAVPRGATVRYDIEIFPTYATLGVGHRLRIAITTADTPHLVPNLPEGANLLGGIYQVRYGPSAPSAVEVPLISAE